MHGLLDAIARSQGTHKDLKLLEELCEVVQATSLCGLGQTAPNPVLSTLRYFRDEYERKLSGPT
jgi:bidirectional [NiFe] hydrogenase diaphorase subunit